MASGVKDTRYLVIGANGLLGRRIGCLLTGAGAIWKGTFNRRKEEGLVKLDITSPADVDDLFSKVRPDVVFHCANLAGGVDFCEKNPKAAVDFHLEAVKRIAGSCEDAGSEMVFISTDYVFDGTKGPYGEDDPTAPLNLYGRLKLEAEVWIRQNLKRHVIVRTTNVYGWDPMTVTPNYMMSMYRTLKENKAFNAPSFLWGNPTYVGDLAQAILELHAKNASGVYHVVGKSFMDRFEWARKACEIFGFDSSLVKEIKDPPANMVPRPLKSWLKTDKFSTANRTVLHDLSDGLKLMRSDSTEPVLEKTR